MPQFIYTMKDMRKTTPQGKEILLRITAPRDGKRLPIILFSHGAQYSKDDYLPLTEFWASHGYVVIQPTHIESLSLGLARNDPRIQDAWKTRVLDLRKALAVIGLALVLWLLPTYVLVAGGAQEDTVSVTAPFPVTVTPNNLVQI